MKIHLYIKGFSDQATSSHPSSDLQQMDIINTTTSLISVMGNATQPIIVATINLNKKLATDQELINLLRNRQPNGTPANSNPVKTILNKSGS